MSEYEELGTQFDGEPAVVEAVQEEVKPAVETPEPEVKEEPATEPEEPNAEVEEDDKPKKKTGSQRARERAERLEIENEILRQQLAGKAPVPPPPASDPNEPTQDQYETVHDYVKAQVEYGTRKALAAAKAQDEQARIATTWDQKKAVLKAAHPEVDVEEVFDNAEPPAPAVAQVIYNTERGAEVALYLGTHEDEYHRINRMSPIAAVRELTLIEAKLTQPKAEPKRTSQAPPPVKPVQPSVITPQVTSKVEEF
jgi:hypothetical protein